MPLKDAGRIQAVNRFLKLEINREKELQEIVRMAAEVCQTPVALITLLDQDTQHIAFKVGFDRESTDRKDAFCDHTIREDRLMIVENALEDTRFINNPLVTGNPHIRFYAGSPLTTQDGYNLGSLCVIDQKSGQLDAMQQCMLNILSKQVTQILEFEMSIEILKQQFTEVKSSETKLRSYFESSDSCHLLLDHEFKIIAFNSALEKFIKSTFGASVELSSDIRQYVHATHQTAFVENYLLALCGTPIKSQRLIPYDNAPIWWSMTYNPACDQDGKIIGVSLNAVNITDLVSQQQLLVDQNEALKKIAYIQSHELRRPVSTILGLMEFFESEDYVIEKADMIIMGEAVKELDEKIRKIVGYTD